MRPNRNAYPDGPPEPGVFDCGDTLVRVGQPGGYTYHAGPDLTDGTAPNEVQLIRTCRCGGWFRAAREQFQQAPPARVEPAPPNCCT